MKLNVPYYSQYLDINDSFWMLRSCGATSFKMVTEFLGKDIGDIVSFCNKARDEGGYDLENGWLHDYILNSAESIKLKAYRKEGMVDLLEIFFSLDSGIPVIVSVEKKVLEQKRFHMIVVVGYEDGNIIYHEPESTNYERGLFRRCDEKTFLEFWRGKAIFISK